MSRVRITSQPQSSPGLEVRNAPFEQGHLWRSSHENGHLSQWPAIFMTQTVYQEVNAHADSDLEHEVGGMLVGGVYQTTDGNPFVTIEAQLPAQHVDQGPAHLTFTSDTLSDLLNRQEDLFPDLRVVGWYHTHPGLSVFLSSYDVWLHTHFFPEPWHVALVIDPIANRAGFFRYRNGGSLDPRHYGGFYELVEAGNKRSVVRWGNLSQG